MYFAPYFISDQGVLLVVTCAGDHRHQSKCPLSRAQVPIVTCAGDEKKNGTLVLKEADD